MFDLEKREKFVLIIFLAALLAGLSLKIYEKYNTGIVDVKIKSFNYKPSSDVSLKININEADEEALAVLDGIGPSLAKRIAVYRSERGGFSTVEELKKVKGIGDKLFEKIKDEVFVQ